jgi:hypothetical protein
MDWSIEKAISEFINLSKQAFSKRKWLREPIVRHAAQLMYSYRYESEGIETALQTAFGHGLLYGFNQSAKSNRVRTGVVAAVRGHDLPFLFTNYSRNSAGSGRCLNVG